MTPMRRGLSIVELIAGLFILSAVLLLLGQAAGVFATLQSHSHAELRIASTCENVLEELTALPYHQITAETCNQQAAKWSDTSLRIAADMTDFPADAPGMAPVKRIHVVAESDDLPGIRCELVAFKHALEREASP